MIYIYKKDGQIITQRECRPQTDERIELERMIPKPVKEGHHAILAADFETKSVWYDLVPTFDEIKRQKIVDINAHDKSNLVNQFAIQDIPMWLDKDTRTGLKLRFDAEKTSGMTETALWYGSTKIILDINAAIELLLQVELYASRCYDITQQHIANVEILTEIEDVTNYNFTVYYPQKLIFTI